MGMGCFQPAFSHLPLSSVEWGRGTSRAIHPVQNKPLKCFLNVKYFLCGSFTGIYFLEYCNYLCCRLAGNTEVHCTTLTGQVPAVPHQLPIEVASENDTGAYISIPAPWAWPSYQHFYDLFFLPFGKGAHTFYEWSMMESIFSKVTFTTSNHGWE